MLLFPFRTPCCGAGAAQGPALGLDCALTPLTLAEAHQDESLRIPPVEHPLPRGPEPCVPCPTPHSAALPPPLPPKAQLSAPTSLLPTHLGGLISSSWHPFQISLSPSVVIKPPLSLFCLISIFFLLVVLDKPVSLHICPSICFRVP